MGNAFGPLLSGHSRSSILIVGVVSEFGRFGREIRKVHHQESSDGELWDVPDLGPCSVTIMLRTGLFPFCRARTRNTTPAPVEFFRALSEAFRVSLAAQTWQLPSLDQCAEFDLAGPTPTPPTKRRR